ncbi:hypothetical protein [uncultured Alistipes sp.]|uniref:hypothetical protein n=1 Tax=uncultured Alistipes sp. TaxID=538949 RepID=UPI0025E01CB5|nr:hypothetical protein [uncultured Alistipes sp.]
MNARTRYGFGVLMAAALMLLAGGCDDASEYYYTTSYPVVRIEVSVTVEEETPEPQPEPEPEPEPQPGEGEGEGGTETDDGTGTGTDTGTGSGTGSDDGTGTGSDDGTVEEPENPLVTQLREEVLAAAPVQAGGVYTLDFKYADSGRLTVRPAAGAETVSGGFMKQPGATAISFYFGEQAYTCTVTAYTSEEGLRQALLTVDLTAEYQARYPDAKITQVLRKEYTSHRQ